MIVPELDKFKENFPEIENNNDVSVEIACIQRITVYFNLKNFTFEKWTKYNIIPKSSLLLVTVTQN